MTLELEDRLHDQLVVLAEPAGAVTLQLDHITRRVTQRRRRRAAARSLLTVGLVAGMAAGVFAVRNGHSQPLDTPATETPAGPAGPTESPLTVEPEIETYMPVVRAGGLEVRLADGQEIKFLVTASPYFDGYAQHSNIQTGIESNGRVIFPGQSAPDRPIEQLGGNNSLAYWTGLPAEVVRVEFRPFEGAALWQTPADGIAAFPTPSHSVNDVYVAFDAAGNEVKRVEWSTVRWQGSSSSSDSDVVSNYWSSIKIPLDSPAIDVSQIESLTQPQEDAYRAFGDDTMRACLARDGDSAWDACIASTDAAVKAYLHEVNDQIATTTTTTTTS